MSRRQVIAQVNIIKGILDEFAERLGPQNAVSTVCLLQDLGRIRRDCRYLRDYATEPVEKGAKP